MICAAKGNQTTTVALQYLHSERIANFTLSSGEVKGVAEVTGHMNYKVLVGLQTTQSTSPDAMKKLIEVGSK